MARSFLFPTLILLAGLPLLAQIIGGPGVGYPGGGYPGRRNPRGAQQPASQRNDPPSTPTLTGILRKIDEKDVIIESDDQAISTVSIPGSTKYTNASGGNAKIGDFQPGDHVRISASKDDKGNYKAQTMAMVREGTLEEHAAASQATDDPTRPITKPASSSSASNSSGNSSGTPMSGDRPQLRRASSSSGDDTGTSPSKVPNDDSDRPKMRRATSSSDDSTANSSSSSSNDSSDSDRPKLRRAPSSSDSTSSSASSSTSNGDSPTRASVDPSSSATIAPRRRSASTPSATTPSPQPDATRDSDDSGPPKLRRAQASDDSAAVVADARPTIHADDSGGVTRLPPPPTEGPARMAGRERITGSGDEFIDRAREAAFSFSETLPNYVVKQYTTRYATGAARGGRTSWQVLDNVTADVIEENGTEKYKNILVNGKPPKENVEDSGSWSSGEFSSLLLDIMSPSTGADFHGKRASTIVNRDAFRYDYSVEQPNSHWKVESRGQTYSPAYTGSIWIDKQTARVLRIELAAQGMPRGFPLDTVESAVDYDFVLIGDGKFLLPVHSEALSCGRGTSDCSRNVIEFRNYRKFTAETSITFEDK
jgi:hypothetical protein